MAENSAIEWTDHTWSPWEGCTKISPGCDGCYAEAMNRWLRAGENWGPGAPRRIYSEDHWEKPVKWQRAALKFETLHGRRQRVFPSVCDPFDNEAPPTLRARLWGLIRLTPAIDWLLLTKRIGNARSMLPADWGDGYANVWLGATMVNQEEVDRDARKLLALPARVHFVSYEPALGPVDLTPWLRPYCDAGSRPHPDGGGTTCPRCNGAGGCAGISWIIAGGESGRKARPPHPQWFRDVRDQCAAAGVPFLFKQWGEWREPLAGEPFDTSMGGAAKPPAFIVSRDNGTVHCFESGYIVDGQPVIRIRKKAAGRLLDGVAHDGFPEVR